MKDARNGPIGGSRRQMRRLAVVAAVALAATACGNGSDEVADEPEVTAPADDEGTATDEETTAEAEPANADLPQPEGTVVFAGPGGGFRTAYEEAFQVLEDEHGITVEYVEGLVAENFARVQTSSASGTSEIDVVIVSPRDNPVGRNQGLFAEIDPAIVTNLADLAEFAVPDDRIGAAVAFSPDGLVYNRQIFEENGWEAPTSWWDYVDETYADCIVPIHPSTNSTYVGMVNYVFSDGDYAGFDATLEQFAPLAERIPVVAGSPIDAMDYVGQGVGCISSSSQGRTLMAEDDNLPFVFPDEGTAVGVISAQIAEAAPNPVAAQYLMDVLLAPDTQQAIMEGAAYSPTNTKVEAPTDGPLSELSVADDFEERGFHVVPPEAYEELDRWVREWDTVFGS